MADKFIKAYCNRSKRYFGLRIEEVDGKLRCTDFYDMKAEDGKQLASTVDVPNLETASNPASGADPVSSPIAAALRRCMRATA